MGSRSCFALLFQCMGHLTHIAAHTYHCANNDIMIRKNLTGKGKESKSLLQEVHVGLQSPRYNLTAGRPLQHPSPLPYIASCKGSVFQISSEVAVPFARSPVPPCGFSMAWYPTCNSSTVDAETWGSQVWGQCNHIANFGHAWDAQQDPARKC